jgi:S-adenosylmethionine:tRNA ribosyltransferase-isomerase
MQDTAGTLKNISARMIEKAESGQCRLHFFGTTNILSELDRLGEMPLPPYIRGGRGAEPRDRVRYQTVYAQPPGSVAAPTAGLHFTEEILAALRRKGIEIVTVTLHVGAGTFAPIKTELVHDHVLHYERYEVPEKSAAIISQAQTEGRRVVAVGTTSVRVLETWADSGYSTRSGKTNLFLRPPAPFHVVNALITNFHLPESSLLMLVSAFLAPGKTGGRLLLLDLYREAIEQQYRFYSYGDAMFIE